MKLVIEQINELFQKYADGLITKNECLCQIILVCAVEQQCLCDAIKQAARNQRQKDFEVYQNDLLDAATHSPQSPLDF